jgi:hypothetical protein
MRLFRHTIAEYRCTKCGHARSIVTPHLSPFSGIAAGAATVPIWLVNLRDSLGFPWYTLPGIFAGELLLVFFAGLLLSIPLAFYHGIGTRVCRDCGGPVVFGGRHFDPLGSRWPHWTDIVILVVFAGLNTAGWFVIGR